MRSGAGSDVMIPAGSTEMIDQHQVGAFGDALGEQDALAVAPDGHSRDESAADRCCSQQELFPSLQIETVELACGRLRRHAGHPM